MAFTFVVNHDTQTAEIISTSKFTSLLNQELIKNLTSIASATVDEPTCVKEAIERFKVYKIPLPQSEPTQPTMKMDESRPFTPSRMMTPITRMSPRMSPITPHYAQLEPEMISQKPPQYPSPRKKRAPTPHKPCFHQTVQETLDNNTKAKLISVLNKVNSDDH
ncbi:Uncharacterized protein QTN25_009623 [Entamoeba marina]